MNTYCVIAFTCLLIPSVLKAEQPLLTPLSLDNFLSEGWDQPWSKWPRGEGTPDMSLLRVQTNFLVQLARLDTAYEVGRTSPAFSESGFATGIVEYAVNRRFMPGFYVSHQWLEGRNRPDDDGSAGGVFGRFQLIEGPESSLALNVKAALPNHDLGEHLTTWSYALAGWRDLAPLGLGRTGLYWHVQHELPAGPRPAGAAHNDVTYALAVATSWTSPHATLANFTTFVEAYGKTLLDGSHAGRTTTTLTPGFRFTLGGKHILMAGVDLPVGGQQPDEAMFRLTWISNF